MSKSKIISVLSAACLALGISSNSQALTETAMNIGVGESAARHFAHNPNPATTSFSDQVIFSFGSGVTSANVSAFDYEILGPGLENITASLYDISGSTLFATGTVNGYSPSTTPLTFNIGSSDIGNVFKLIVEGDVGAGGLYSVNISAVPLPAAAWLFISGLLAVGGMSYVKRRKASNQDSGNAVPA